jgi:hypothetical protein
VNRAFVFSGAGGAAVAFGYVNPKFVTFVRDSSAASWRELSLEELRRGVSVGLAGATAEVIRVVGIIDDGSYISATLASGSTLVATGSASTQGATDDWAWVGYDFLPSASSFNKVQGLCGSWDGLAWNDYTPKGESVTTSSDEFGESFKVSVDSSLFPPQLKAICRVSAPPNHGGVREAGTPAAKLRVQSISDSEARACCEANGLSSDSNFFLFEACVLDVTTAGSCARQIFQTPQYDAVCSNLPNLCNNRGVCAAGSCTCASGWTGEFCTIPVCACEPTDRCVFGICIPTFVGECFTVDAKFGDKSAVAASASNCACVSWKA